MSPRAKKHKTLGPGERRRGAACRRLGVPTARREEQVVGPARAEPWLVRVVRPSRLVALRGWRAGRLGRDIKVLKRPDRARPPGESRLGGNKCTAREGHPFSRINERR